MKFSIAVTMQRYDPSEDMRTIIEQSLQLVQLAEQGGFEVAWAAEHHTIEMAIGPSPFVQLTHWAMGTSRIRLGTGIITAPYWHPIRLAGEAAYFDQLSGGRLELGVGRGAYQYEFDRLIGGVPQQTGVAYMKESLPAVRRLWAGDYAHDGTYWRWPAATSVPKPLQQPHPPIWVAARDPGTFDWAIVQGFDIMSTPLSRPVAEIRILGDKFEKALADNPGVPRPRFMMQRTSFVYPEGADWRRPAEAAIRQGSLFENLFQSNGVVASGFARPIDISTLPNRANYDAGALHANMLYGTPGEVIEKLRAYEEAGVDLFSFLVPNGMSFKENVRSVELFAERVMPAFAGKEARG